jgi:hypothetical protein
VVTTPANQARRAPPDAGTLLGSVWDHRLTLSSRCPTYRQRRCQQAVPTRQDDSMFLFFSNRLGCGLSLLLSLAVTGVLLLVFTR